MNCSLVIVFFCPTKVQVNRWSEKLEVLKKNFYIIVIDNSPQPQNSESIPHDMYFYNANRGGLAGAYNLAIDQASDRNINFLMLCDQDSLFSDEYFEFAADLPAEFCGYAACGSAVSAGTGVRIAPAGVRIVEGRSIADYPINSGMVLYIPAIRLYGGFCSELGVDYIDTELWFRMKSRGLPCIWSKDLKFSHSIGRNKIFLGRTLSLDSSSRYLRRWRSFLRTIWIPHMPLLWKAKELLKLTVKSALILSSLPKDVQSEKI